MNRAQTLTISVLALFLHLGCASKKIQRIKPEYIQNNKNKLFKIGMVKVAIPGNLTPFSNALNQKIAVLNEIPIGNICKTLEATYGINIDTNTDGLIHKVFEIYGSNTLVPYYGNTKYTKRSFFKTLVGIRQKVIKAESPSNAIDITYELQIPPFGIGSFTCLYSIFVRSDDQEIILYRGIVFKGPMPVKNLIFDAKSMWEQLRTGARRLNDIFVGDIKKLSKTGTEKTVP